MKSEFGYHVLLLEDERTQDAPSFDAMRNDLKTAVERDKLQKHIQGAHRGGEGCGRQRRRRPLIVVRHEMVNPDARPNPFRVAVLGCCSELLCGQPIIQLYKQSVPFCLK